jgi:hypothetical protein
MLREHFVHPGPPEVLDEPDEPRGHRLQIRVMTQSASDFEFCNPWLSRINFPRMDVEDARPFGRIDVRQIPP